MTTHAIRAGEAQAYMRVAKTERARFLEEPDQVTAPQLVAFACDLCGHVCCEAPATSTVWCRCGRQARVRP